jgi:HSP20 family protein
MALLTRVHRTAADPFDGLARDFDQLLKTFIGTRDPSGVGFAPYAVDIWEDADHLHVQAELPGFTREQVDVTLDSGTLTITAVRENDTQKPANADSEANEWLLRERRFTRFQRSFSLPSTIDESSVTAKLENGILGLTLSKKSEAKPRRITIG